MNTYFVVSIQYNEDSNPINISGFETRDAAMSAYHGILASNYISESLTAFSVAVLNAHGGTEIREFWEKPAPEPGPEPNEE